MSDQIQKPHSPPFLNELAPHAVLDAAILRGPVSGPHNIRRIVGVVGGLFASQSPGFHAAGENLEIHEYKAALPDGQSVNGVVTVTRGLDGLVEHVGSYMTPLSSVLAVATAVRQDLSPDFDAALFI